MKAIRFALVGVATLVVTVAAAACGGGQGAEPNQAAAGNPANAFPCTGYPADGTTTPPDLALPLAPTSAESPAGMVKGGSVTGPTSYFGGDAGGAPGPMALTQQFPDGKRESGNKPCNDTPGSGYHSYFVAMRFNPDPSRNPNIFRYGEWYCPLTADGARVPDTECLPDTPDGRYKQWDKGQGGMWGPVTWTLSYLYGRKILVTRTFTDKQGAKVKKAVVARAADRGPDQDQEQWRKRPIDLSPWVMGSLDEDPKCADWDGTDAMKSQCQFPEPPTQDDMVTACWAMNDLPLGPVDPNMAKCAYEVSRPGKHKQK